MAFPHKNDDYALAMPLMIGDTIDGAPDALNFSIISNLNPALDIDCSVSRVG